MIVCRSCGAQVRAALDICPRCGDLVDLAEPRPPIS